MEKIAWITDSTALMDPETAKENQIHVVPLNVIFGDENYREGIDIDPNEFYRKIKTSEALPTTSQPAVGEFVELFKKLKNEYTRGIAVHLSAVHSGTCSTAAMAAQIAEFPVEVINSKITLEPLAQLVMEGIKMESAGKTYNEIVDKLRELTDKIKLYFIVEDLSHLHRGGRLSITQFLVGSLLSIKPILTVIDGKITPFDKIRTLRKAKERILEKLDEDIAAGLASHISIFHANNENEALTWKEELMARYPNILPKISLVSAVVGVHTGPGTLGLSWFRV